MDAERAARQIIGAVRQRRPEIILTPAAQLVSRVAGLAPGLTSEVLHLVQRLALPAPPGQPAQEGDEPIPGHELNPALPRKAFDRLTTLGRAAADRFNERPRLSRLPRPGRPPGLVQDARANLAAVARPGIGAARRSRSAWRAR
jgi:hypothetical protein